MLKKSRKIITKEEMKKRDRKQQINLNIELRGQRIKTKMHLLKKLNKRRKTKIKKTKPMMVKTGPLKNQNIESKVRKMKMKSKKKESK
jgi:hypothetical protein